MTEIEMREFLSAYFEAALNEPDPAGYVALFAEDGVLEDPVGTPPYRGPQAIGQYVSAGKALIERVELEVHEVFACGIESAARWTMTVHTKRGDHVVVQGIGTFTFDEHGKLRHVREFYDVGLLMKIFAA